MGWRWTVRQETMREGCYRHSITVDAPGGVAFSYLVIIKSMTHTLVPRKKPAQYFIFFRQKKHLHSVAVFDRSPATFITARQSMYYLFQEFTAWYSSLFSKSMSLLM
jgi:hypothetical protein